MLAASIFMNALSVYVLHDVDADRIGKLNLAYRELMEEFLLFAVVATAVFLLVVWLGSMVLRLGVATSGPRLAFILGAAVIVIQYPAEFAIRVMNRQHSSESFLLAYLLGAPVCCAAIVIWNARRRRSMDQPAKG
jgi:hypothetical protein